MFLCIEPLAVPCIDLQHRKMPNPAESPPLAKGSGRVCE